MTLENKTANFWNQGSWVYLYVCEIVPCLSVLQFVTAMMSQEMHFLWLQILFGMVTDFANIQIPCVVFVLAEGNCKFLSENLFFW